MDLLNDLKNLKHHEISFGVLCFLGILAPGILIIFQFRPDLFQTLDTFKLIVLGLALTLPIGLYNSFVVFVHKQGRFENAGLACALTFLLTYPLVFVAFLCEFRFRTFLWLLMALEFLALIALRISRIRRKRKAEAEEKKTNP